MTSGSTSKRRACDECSEYASSHKSLLRYSSQEQGIANSHAPKSLKDVQDVSGKASHAIIPNRRRWAGHGNEIQATNVDFQKHR